MLKSLTQKAIAADLGLDVTAYNRIENGKTQLTVANLFAIAESLQVDMDYILQLRKKSIDCNGDVIRLEIDNEYLNIYIDSKHLLYLLKFRSTE